MIPDYLEEVLRQEAACLDAQLWDKWLDLYTADCEYWVPAWKGNDELNSDPQTELSHIYYPNRAGLADRVARITSKQAIASRPMPRSAHFLGGIVLAAAPTTELATVHCSWTSHVHFPRTRQSHTFFGLAEYQLKREDKWRIHRKKVTLHNDYIPTLVDIYCL